MKIKLLVSLLTLLLCAREAAVNAAQLPPGDPAAPTQFPPKVPPQQPSVPALPVPPKVAPQQPPLPGAPGVPVAPGAQGVPVPPVLPGRARQPIVPPQGQPGAPIAPPQFTPQQRIAPPPTIPSGGMVSLNFTRADLVEIIHIIAQHLRLTYTIDPEVKGTVTINSAEPLRSEDLMPIFHQILRMNGAVAVRTGNLYHVTTLKDGKGLARPVTQGREDSFALQIVPVRFFTVAEMKKVLQPFMMPGSELIENPRGNFLIIIDTPSNIQRLVEIADLIDVQIFAGTRMEIYQPKVASAEELAQEMTKLMQSFSASAAQADSFTAQFIPLPRINQLLVISHSEAAWTYARRWLERIDVVAEGPGRRIFIYPVENGKAQELADVLSQALGIASGSTRSQTPTLQSLHRSTPGTSNQSGTGSSFGQSGGLSNQPRTTGSAFATIPVPGQPANPIAPIPGQPPLGIQQQPGVQRPATPGQTTAAQQEQLRIVADASTNSLIIYGTAQEFQNIRNILKELDIVPRQVLIDALILQVDLRDTEQFGVDYEILRQSTTIFGQNYRSLGALRTLGSLFSSPSAVGAITGSGLTGIAGDNNVQAMIRALATDSRVKVISSPSVLATDNRPARIQVGTEEPIPTGTINAAVGNPNISSSTTIQYRNTGRILTIIPQVNSQGLVHLQLKAEVSSRGDPVRVGQDDFPAFNTQDAETNAVVQDGETLVIGGLIGDRKSRGRSGIPFLMDLPVVGRFFSTTSDESQRTELIMLITPRVIRNREESRLISEEFKGKLNTVRTELEKMRYDRERDQERQRRLRQPYVPVPDQMPEGEIQMQPAPAEQQTPVRPAPAPAQMQPSAPTPPKQATNVIQQPQVAPVNPLPAVPAKAPGMFSPKVSQPSPLPVELVPAPVPVAPQAAIELPPAAANVVEPIILANVPQAEVPPAPVAALITPPSDGVALLLNSIEAKAVPEAKAEPAQPRISQGPVWVVQVASYANEADAKNFAGKLRSKGYDANISTADIGGKARYRVEVGQLPTRNQALALQKELRSTQRIDDSLVLSKIAPLNP